MFMVCVVVFFFKQKTAYEMRISDWSSDVCSSDLDDVGLIGGGRGIAIIDEGPLVRLHRAVEIVERRILAETLGIDVRCLRVGLGADDLRVLLALRADRRRFLLARGRHALERSEEHTSELQSLMRISYAVFC